MSDLTISTAELVKIGAAFPAVSSVGMTAKGAYALRKARVAVAAAMQTYDATRIDLAKEHARKDEADKPVTIRRGDGSEVFDIADETAFMRALAQVQSEPVTLPGVRPLRIEEFGDAEISEETMTLLGPLVVEE